jgi:mannose-6-phosphate isomerase-like protein (cupin superfamily)
MIIEARTRSGPDLEDPLKREDHMENQNIEFHQPADTGPSYWGPADRYTFLVAGAQNNRAYFIMEGIIPSGGGPPLHIHHREQESYYPLEGTLEITLDEKKVNATTGDFVEIPRGLVHRFQNTGSATVRPPSFSRPQEWKSILRKR